MPNLAISQATISDSQMITLVDGCRNITVGDYKYQLYCQTVSSSGCTYLPSSYTSSGSLDCPSLTSQATLQDIYYAAGEACAINCYYPLSFYFPSFSIPPIPSFTYPTSYPTTSSISWTIPTPTNSPGNTTITGPVSGNSGNSGNTGTNNAGGTTGNTGVGTNGGNSGSGNNGGGGIIIPLVPNNGTLSGAMPNAMDSPNFMLTFFAVFAIMFLFVRRAI